MSLPSLALLLLLQLLLMRSFLLFVSLLLLRLSLLGSLLVLATGTCKELLEKSDGLTAADAGKLVAAEMHASERMPQDRKSTRLNSSH